MVDSNMDVFLSIFLEQLFIKEKIVEKEKKSYEENCINQTLTCNNLYA